MHLGLFPLERLARTDAEIEYPFPIEHRSLDVEAPDNPLSLANAFREYIDLFDRMRLGDPAPKQAPIPSDPQERANHLKVACYNLDVSMAATCAIPEQAILEKPVVNESLKKAEEKEYLAGSATNVVAETSIREGREAWQRSLDDAAEKFDHGYALILLVEYTREPDPDSESEAWLVGTQARRATVRVAEAAAVMVNYIRMLGFSARLHTATATDVDLNVLLLCSGLGEISNRNGSSTITNPYLGDQFGMAVVSTTMEMAADIPLAERGFKEALESHGPGWWLGLDGARPGYKGRLFKNRPFRLGPYPMEKLKPQETTTTLIDKPNVPRIPKRHDMFMRAALGDLGEKPQKELENFDFGLQDFCEKCTKCARECPCQAIPYGDKIMFNGYEIWKPDVEKCARYRITNAAGALCGRCMKTCPWNIEGVLAEKPFLWAAMNLPFTRKWIARLDDKVGNGLINPVKKWWWDLDSDEHGNIIPAKRTNERQFSKRTNMDPAKQSMGCYPADIASPPVSEHPIILHRKIAVERYRNAESPDKYKARKIKDRGRI